LATSVPKKSGYVSNGTMFFPVSVKADDGGGAKTKKRYCEREAVTMSGQRVMILPAACNVEGWGGLVQVVGA